MKMRKRYQGCERIEDRQYLTTVMIAMHSLVVWDVVLVVDLQAHKDRQHCSLLLNTVLRSLCTIW